MSEIFEDDRLDSLKLIRLLYKKRWLLIIVGAISFGGSVLVTTFIAPKFFSNGIIYATASNASEDVLTNPQFGFEVHADRLMQILESETVRDSIIKKFNLIDYYELDTARKDWEYVLHKNFAEDVTFFRSKYMSIVISATTREPELSANIVNGIIDMADVMRKHILKTNAYASFKNIESDYLRKSEEVDQLVDSIHRMKESSAGLIAGEVYYSLKQMRETVKRQHKALAEIENKHNIYDLEQQLKDIGGKLIELRTRHAGLKGKRNVLVQQSGPTDTAVVRVDAEISRVEAEMKVWQEEKTNLSNIQSKWRQRQEQLFTSNEQLGKLRSEYTRLASSASPNVQDVRIRNLELQLENELKLLSDQKERYDLALSSYEQDLPKVYVIDRAKPSFKKVSPSYTFNAMMGTLGGVTFCILFLVFWDRFSALRRDALKESE